MVLRLRKYTPSGGVDDSAAFDDEVVGRCKRAAELREKRDARGGLEELASFHVSVFPCLAECSSIVAQRSAEVASKWPIGP